jgi:Flp pilus assembly protein protease CpaA
MNYIAGGFLAVLGIEDFKKKTIPVWMLLIGGISALIYCIKNLSIEVVLAGCIPGMLMILISKLLPKSLGIGDGVLVILYGMVYGWEKTCVWLMNSFLLVSVIGLIMGCIYKTHKLELPFVPFMTFVHLGMCL